MTSRDQWVRQRNRRREEKEKDAVSHRWCSPAVSCELPSSLPATSSFTPFFPFYTFTDTCSLTLSLSLFSHFLSHFFVLIDAFLLKSFLFKSGTRRRWRMYRILCRNGIKFLSVNPVLFGKRRRRETRVKDLLNKDVFEGTKKRREWTSSQWLVSWECVTVSRLDLQIGLCRRSKERREKKKKKEHEIQCFDYTIKYVLEKKEESSSHDCFFWHFQHLSLFCLSFCPSSSILALEKEGTNFLLQFFILFKTRCSQYFCKRWKWKRERREILFLVFGPKATRASSSSWQRHQNQILLLVPRCNSLCSILWIFNPSHYLCSIPSKGIRIFRSCSTNCSVLDILCPHIDNMILSITFAKNSSLDLVIAHNIFFPALLEL